MKLVQMRWILVGILALIQILAILYPGPPVSFGVSMEYVNGEYRYAGGTGPALLGFAILFTGAYFLVVHGEPPGTGKPFPGIFRRWVASIIDMMIVIIALGSVFGAIPILLEWHRTGQFQWTFERSTRTPWDAAVALTGVSIMFAGMLFYETYALVKQRPSPGACIMGYRIVPDEGTSLDFKRAMLRSLLGFVALCAAYLAPFILRDRKKGKFWLDKVFSTHAVTLR